MHLPPHRQCDRFVREGVPIADSALADWVGAVTVSLAAHEARIEDHVRAAEPIHVDDTPVGRKNGIFAGSDAGARRAAAMGTLIETAKLDDDDPRAQIADMLARFPGHPARAMDARCPGVCQRFLPGPYNGLSIRLRTAAKGRKSRRGFEGSGAKP